jgi:hypothetical protein
LKHIAVAFSGVKFLPELITSVKKVIDIRLPVVLKFAGLGYKTLTGAYSKPLAASRRFLAAMILLRMPTGPFPVGSLVEWFTLIKYDVYQGIPEGSILMIFHKVFHVVLKTLTRDIEKVMKGLRKELSCESEVSFEGERGFLGEHGTWFNVEILSLLAPLNKHYEAACRIAKELWILGGDPAITLEHMLDMVERFYVEISLIPNSLFDDPEAKAKLAVGMWIKMWVLIHKTLLEQNETAGPVRGPENPR